MSIATRIQEIENHLEDDYNALEGIGADLTNVDKNIVNIASVLNDIYDEMPKVSATGTELTLNNTRKGKMITDLQPNTSQDSTTGDNLFDKTQIEIGKTWYGSDNTKRARFYVEYTPNQYYTIITNSLPNGISTYGIVESSSLTSTTGNKYYSNELGNIFEHQFNAEARYLIFQFETTNAFTQEDANAINIDLREGAMPSPTYPQDIKVVTGDNTIKVQNKNLLNTSNVTLDAYFNSTTGAITTDTSHRNCVFNDYIKVKPNTQYTISTNSSTVASQFSVCEYKDNKEFFNYIASGNWDYLSYTFTTSANASYIRIRYKYSNNDDITTQLINSLNIQIEKNNEATTYVSHKEQNYLISLGNIEYCVIGDNKDRIFKNVVGDVDYDSTRELGKWYIKKNIGKKTLTGALSESWKQNPSATLTNTNYFSSTAIDSTIATNFPIGLTNYFTRYDALWSNDVEGIQFSTESSRKIRIRINKTTASDETSFKTWLSTHNTDVYFGLKTPTYTLLDNTLQTQLDNLSKALSYDEQTNISQVNDDLPFILDISALKDISNL